jgi:hypothetical protein
MLEPANKALDLTCAELSSCCFDRRGAPEGRLCMQHPLDRGVTVAFEKLQSTAKDPSRSEETV